jgi:GT2 family glycosyltransferase
MSTLLGYARKSKDRTKMTELYIYGSKADSRDFPRRTTFFPDPDTALYAIEKSKNDKVVLCDSNMISKIDFERIDFDSFDLLHAGLSLGTRGTFESLMLTSLNWFFLDPQKENSRSISWKATPAFCCMSPDAVRAIGGFDSSYSSATARLMDLAYRILVAGGRVLNDSHCLKDTLPAEVKILVSLEDEFIFILRHLGKKAALYAATWLCLSTYKTREVINGLKGALTRVKKCPVPHPEKDLSKYFNLLSRTKKQKVENVSAIIPTINRYDYVTKAIESLLKQNPRPDEIIIVDQTPYEKRRPELYEPYEAESIRIIYLDQAGQSIARNVGIESSKNEWCLLFEDDTVAWDDLIAEHIRILEYSGAHASTGVSLAPWKTPEYIPKKIRHIHLADVLASGNCLIKKEALIDVGGFDRAFDLGSGADNDLGTRLYLKGYEILFTPLAIETHYKAATGGMRTHGAWWRHKSAFWAPYPPPTQIYTIQKNYPQSYWLPHYLRFVYHAKQHHNLFEYMWLLLSMPWKFVLALGKARQLKKQSNLQ